MQGFERMDRELLDAAVGKLVPAGSMFAFLAAHRADLFPDEDHADLFAPPGVGRPSLPATRMAVVLTLQVLHDYSDRETAEAFRFDVRWKAAAGVPLDDPGFDPSSLVYWRNRIARSARPHQPAQRVRHAPTGGHQHQENLALTPLMSAELGAYARCRRVRHPRTSNIRLFRRPAAGIPAPFPK
jgi:hypothetical protein